jgi:hypothetical protein
MYVYLQAYEQGVPAKQPLVAFVSFYQEQTKAFETQPMEITQGLNSRLQTMPFSFSIPLSQLPPGEYECQISVLNPAGQKAAFWQAQVKVVPFWPEMDFPASDARKTARAAMSFGSTKRCNDSRDIADALSSSSDLPPRLARAAMTRSIRSPATGPGRMAFTRMLNSPSSRERVLVKPISPHLLAA